VGNRCVSLLYGCTRNCTAAQERRERPCREAEDRNQEKNERQLSKWIGIAAFPPKNAIKHQGQKDIEMLFDRQRPKVGVSSSKITLDKEDIVKCWFYDPAHAVETGMDQPPEHDSEDQNIERRIKLEPSAYREPGEVDPPAF
jgi:hypothetical protein